MRAKVLAKSKVGTANKPSPEEEKKARDFQVKALYSPLEDYEPRNAAAFKSAQNNKERSIPLVDDRNLPARTRFGLILTWKDPFFFLKILQFLPIKDWVKYQ
jgi:hypothetical protein